MECPVCYENEACCKFTCGHGFCKECTKSWYMKGKSSCPMCRASMCFKGITKLKKRWHREKQEKTYENLVTLIFDELMEEYDDIVLQCLEVVQNRFEYTMLKQPNISCEELDIVLRMTWVDVDYLLNSPSLDMYEPMTFTRYLMVSKHKYINRRLPYHIYPP
jgi:RING-finger-containing E3 ubiquitin ligase